METGSIIIFFLVYVGMILGNWPGLAIDRTGIALLGAIAFILLQNTSFSSLLGIVDLSVIAILFSFMVISAQLYFSGFYTHLVGRIAKWKLSPTWLLLAIILISGGLSAVLLNDIVCLALTPLIIQACSQRQLNPVPFLLGLACASNIGSSLTLIGNPQNILVGQALAIPLAHYMKYAILPCLLGLFFTWGIIHWQTRNRWIARESKVEFSCVPYLKWQSLKGLLLLGALFVIFLCFDVPRDRIALIAAGLILLSRRMASHTMLNFIDWQLLVLFIGLFIINKGLLTAYQLNMLLPTLQSYHIDLHSPFWIFTFSIILSNLVSNVPAVMLLLPFVGGSFNGSLLAVSSTLAGNLLLIGSLANVIVVSQAGRLGVKISWKKHFAVGLPLALVTLLITAGWFYFLTLFN